MDTNQSRVDKKKRGVFYTPAEIAQILCDWAIRTPDDLILEPSFGGCHFLSAARNRLDNLGSQNPDFQMYGCDIDPAAFSYLNKLLKIYEDGRFLQQDFLLTHIHDFNQTAGFDAVVGNPPYISNHNLTQIQYKTGREAIEDLNVALSGKASLWAYFVLHGMSFTNVGARMAWVLPSSFLYADYAEQVKKIVRKRFARCLIIQLGERLFLNDGTEEVSVILLCDTFQESDSQEGDLDIIYLSKANEIKDHIEKWESGNNIGNPYSTNAKLPLLKDNERKSYLELAAKDNTLSLGDYCEIKIGIVTGANDFFIITEENALSANLPDISLVLILAKFHYAEGITIKRSDILKIKKEGRPCFLVDTTKVKRKSKALHKYLQSFPDDKKSENTTFRRRIRTGKPWHQFNDDRIPDAFFPYMLKNGPRIIVNQGKVNSTNSIHRLYFNKNFPRWKIKAIAISIISTFSQLSSEIEGRAYGAGVLKHEPSEVARIKILLPINFSKDEVKDTFIKTHELISANDHIQARNLADNFVMKDFSEREKKIHLKNLSTAIKSARNQRLPNWGL